MNTKTTTPAFGATGQNKTAFSTTKETPADPKSKWADIYKNNSIHTTLNITENTDFQPMTRFAMQCIDYLLNGAQNKAAKNPKYTKTTFSNTFTYKEAIYQPKAKTGSFSFGAKTTGTSTFGAKKPGTAILSKGFSTQTKFIDYSKAVFDEPASYKPESSKVFFMPTPTKVQADQTSIEQLREEITSSKQIEEDYQEQEELQFNYQTLFDHKSPITDNFRSEKESIQPIQIKDKLTTNNENTNNIVAHSKINSIIIKQSEIQSQSSVITDYYNISREGCASIDVIFPEQIKVQIPSLNINIGECFLDLHQLSTLSYEYSMMVTVYNCWPKDEHGFRSPENDDGNYENVLQEYCRENNLQFIHYSHQTGILNFQIYENNKPNHELNKKSQEKKQKANPSYGVYQIP